MADGWACAPDFARNPRSRADPSSPPARHALRPNRVHLRLGLAFRLGLLSTCPRGHAVALGYLEVARCFKTQTFTGWFHKRISARSAVTCRRFPPREACRRDRTGSAGQNSPGKDGVPSRLNPNSGTPGRHYRPRPQGPGQRQTFTPGAQLRARNAGYGYGGLR